MKEAISEKTIEELKKIEHQLSRIDEIVLAGKIHWQGDPAAVRYENYSDAVSDARRILAMIKADHSVGSEAEYPGTEAAETTMALPDNVIE